MSSESGINMVLAKFNEYSEAGDIIVSIFIFIESFFSLVCSAVFF